jgi:hypothetical protein
VDGNQRATRAVQVMLQDILANRRQAAAYAEDPAGYVRARGIAEDDLAGSDPVRLVRQACCYVSLPPLIAPGYAGGAEEVPPVLPAGSGPHESPTDRLVRCINYVALVSYRGDAYLTSRLTSAD